MRSSSCCRPMRRCSSPRSPTGAPQMRPARRSRRWRAKARRRCAWSRTPTSLPASAITSQRPCLVVGFAAETQNLVEQRRGQAEEEGRRLHRRQRRLRRERRHGRRQEPRQHRFEGRRRMAGDDKDEVAARLAALIAERLKTVEVELGWLDCYRALADCSSGPAARLAGGTVSEGSWHTIFPSSRPNG